MRTRRGILGGCAGALGMLAGCGALRGDGGTDTPAGSTATATPTDGSGGAPADDTPDPTETDAGSGERRTFETGGTGDLAYDDWYGPEMASAGPSDGGDVRNFVGVQAYSVPRVRSNDALPDWFRGRVEGDSFSATGAEFDLSEGEIEWWIGGNYPWNSLFLEGAFDPGTLEAGLSEDASHEGTTRGVDVYTAPTKGGRAGAHEAIAIGPEQFLIVRRMPDPETALTAARRTLETNAGEHERFSETSGDFARIVRDLGEGLFVRVGHSDASSYGVRLRSDGSMLHRRAVYIYRSAEAAADDPTTNEAAVERQREAEETYEVRPRSNRFTVYDAAERQQDGRYVVIDGTLPVEELGGPDLER